MTPPARSPGERHPAEGGALRVGEVRHSLGNRIEVLGTGRSSGGARVVVRVSYAPHGRRPPLHLHPHQTETFSVREGELTVRWPSEERRYTAGDTFHVPPGTPHAMHNAGGGVAVVDWSVEPALRSDELFARLYGARPRPALADVFAFVRHVVVSRRFRAEIVPVGKRSVRRDRSERPG